MRVDESDAAYFGEAATKNESPDFSGPRFLLLWGWQARRRASDPSRQGFKFPHLHHHPRREVYLLLPLFG